VPPDAEFASRIEDVQRAVSAVAKHRDDMAALRRFLKDLGPATA
jgi:hypothetical protein